MAEASRAVMTSQQHTAGRFESSLASALVWCSLRPSGRRG